MVEVPVASAGAAYLRFDASTGKTACFGDSGGPAYAVVGGALRVAGVASTADAECAHVATYRRVSDVYTSFIAPIISASPPCETCGDGGAGQGGAGQSGAGGSSSSSSAGGSPDGAGGTDGGSGGHGAGVVDPDAEPACIPLELSCAVEEAGGGAPKGGIGLLALVAAFARRRRDKRRAPAPRVEVRHRRRFSCVPSVRT
jgi:MYXO-CTERM domain-containing protein